MRSEEWLVRNAEASTDGGQLLICEGITELVRGTEAHFLTQLEDDIRVLDPADTVLIPDPSPQFSASLLYIESLRLRSIPNDDQIRRSQHCVMKPNCYQFDPARIALRQPRPRMLIADAVGLGKTLEAGILVTELMQRGRGKRILVITVKSMLTQFQKEWWSRFTIPLVRLDSVGLARVRDRIPANHNPFNYYDKTIISMDTLKNNLEYRNYLERAYWDIIVIDECHNVAMRANDQGSSLRARLARLLSRRSDALILLSATPHDGSARSFASLINLLDKTVIPDPDNYTADDYRDKGLVVRRFKKDIKDEVSEDFQERITDRLSDDATSEEEAAYQALLDIPFTQGGKRAVGRSYELQRIGMQKALFSSPAAAIQSTQDRMKRLERFDNQTEAVDEYIALDEFLKALHRITKDRFSKYALLLSALQLGEYRWDACHTNDRIVLFSERIETLNWLSEHLSGDLSLPDKALAMMHGGLTDMEQQNLVDRFGRQDDPIRILLCSDVASEGLNLHHYCHRVIHFDMPWSLMTYLQRNGRVDRFGQTRRPIILYLATNARNEKIRGDQRILEVLQAKDNQAHKNLGDPLSFLDRYDVDQEVEAVSGFMADGQPAEAVLAILDATARKSASNQIEQFNAIIEALRQGTPRPPSGSTGPVPEGKAMFEDHYAFAHDALELLSRNGRKLQWSADEASKTIVLTAPRDLEVRLRQIPREAQHTPYVMTSNRERIAAAMEEARQAKAEEQTWPKIQYLWPQHPIYQWLSDMVISEFRGHRAPVLRVQTLPLGQAAFITSGTIPNRKGQPVVMEWQVVVRSPSEVMTIEPFDVFLSRTRIAARAIPNAGGSVPEELQEALPDAVEAMRAHMVRAQREFEAAMAPQLQKALDELDALRDRQLSQLTLDFEDLGGLEAVRKSRAAARAEEIEQEFRTYREWIHDTMETEPQPVIQVVAAVHNLQGRS